MKVALDPNLLVRLLTNDDLAQAALVKAWLATNAIRGTAGCKGAEANNRLPSERALLD